MTALVLFRTSAGTDTPSFATKDIADNQEYGKSSNTQCYLVQILVDRFLIVADIIADNYFHSLSPFNQ